MNRSIAITATTYTAGSLLHERYHDGATLSLIFRGGYTERVKPPRIEHSNHTPTEYRRSLLG